MKVSTKSRYGIRALMDLAVNSGNSHVSLVHIATRNQISVPYLEHVFSALKREGIVKSVKGAQGGYVLAEVPEGITVERIIRAVDGDYEIERESLKQDELGNTVSAVMDEFLWAPLNEQAQEFLQHITLADLVDEFRKRNEAEQSMYYI